MNQAKGKKENFIHTHIQLGAKIFTKLKKKKI